MMEGRRGGKFNFGHIIGDPFALATISIAIVRITKYVGKTKLTPGPACLVDRICRFHNRRHQIAIP